MRPRLVFVMLAAVAACGDGRPGRMPVTPREPGLAKAVRAGIDARMVGTRALDPAVPLESRGATVLAVVFRDRTEIFAQGTTVPGGRPADGDTLFRICSVTKVMTGAMLGDALLRGRLRLEDPAQDHLATLKLPRHPSGPIRIEHLATCLAT